jgi:hypothetical protein
METLDNPVLWTNFILWISNTALALLIATMCFNRSEKSEDTQRRTFKTWTFFFIFLAISNVLMLIWRFAISDALWVDILERTSNVLFYAACFIKVNDIEKSVIKSEWYKRYYFSAISLIAIFVNAIVPPSTLKIISIYQVVFIGLVTASYAVFPIIYFYVALKSSDTIRRGALKVCVGAVFLALGYLFRPENLEAYRGISSVLNSIIDSFYITAPIAIFLAMFLIYSSFRNIE